MSYSMLRGGGGEGRRERETETETDRQTDRQTDEREEKIKMKKTRMTASVLTQGTNT